MPVTSVRSSQILDATVARADLNVATPGQAVVAKIVAGTGISISSTGADTGTGDVTISASSGTVAAHHTTHEIGGTDVIQNNAWTNQVNTFVTNQMIQGAGGILNFWDTGAPAGTHNVRWYYVSGGMYLQDTDDALVYTGVNPFCIDRLGNTMVYNRLQIGPSTGIMSPSYPALRVGTASPDGYVMMEVVVGDNSNWAGVRASKFISNGVYNNLGDLTCGATNFTAGVTCSAGDSQFRTATFHGRVYIGTAAGEADLVTTLPIYPGLYSAGWTTQINYWLGSHSSYGLYTNTGLYVSGNLWVVGTSTLGTTTIGSSSIISGGNHMLQFYDPGAGVDQKRWRMLQYSDGIFRLEGLNDANSAVQQSYQFGRDSSFTSSYGTFFNLTVNNVITGFAMSLSYTGTALTLTGGSLSVAGFTNLNVTYLNTTGFYVGSAQPIMQIHIPSTGTSAGVLIMNASTSGNLAFESYWNSGNAQVGYIAQSGGGVVFSTTSDQRLKNDLGHATDLTNLRKLIIHDFTWKEDGRKDRGIFAQEAYELFPNAISKPDDDGVSGISMWGADYSRFVADLILGWQQHEEEIAELKALVKGLIH